MERAKAWEAGTRLSTGSKLWNAERAKAWEAGSRRSERGREGRVAVAEADLTTRSADRLARRQHVKGEAGGLLQAPGEGSPEVRNVYEV